MRGLAGRVCIVTGAAQGIGKGIARRLLEEGARVWLADLRDEAIRAAAAELEAIAPGAVGGGVADVSHRDQVAAMVEAAASRWGRLDVLVANAGIARRAAFLEIADAEWDAVLETNLRGAFLCTQLAARRMAAQGGGGAIVAIASTNGLRGQPGLAPYGASKAGILNLVQTAALELGAHGIRVNAVCPGTIRTETDAGAPWDDALWREIRAHTALDRFGSPADVAAAVAYLASDDAAFVTGSVLTVDGGLTARQLTIRGERIADAGRG